MFIVWGGKKRIELKVTLGLKGPTAIAQDLSWPLYGDGLLAAFTFCSANKEESTEVCPEEQSSVSQIQSWQHHEWMFAFCQALVVHLPCV